MPATIIIPAYNEEQGITEVLEELCGVFDDGTAVEILVVDDASTDQTAQKTEEFISSKSDWNGSLRLIRHETNRGYGASLKSGVRESEHEHIVITDADGTYPASAILELLEALEQNEMAVGARTGANVQIPLVRRPAKWFLAKLANYLAGVKIPDLNSGLRAMRKSSVERHLSILPNGFSFTTTMTMALLSSGSGVHFKPIDYRPRKGRSKIRPIRDTLNFISLILRTTIYFNPLKVFLPIALLLELAAAGVFVWSWRQGQILDATVSILFMTGVQAAILGLLADLVVRRTSN